MKDVLIVCYGMGCGGAEKSLISFLNRCSGKILYARRDVCYSSGLLGRLVQLVRILGRHPRGRGFEFLTAHHINTDSFKERKSTWL